MQGLDGTGLRGEEPRAYFFKNNANSISENALLTIEIL